MSRRLFQLFVFLLFGIWLWNLTITVLLNHGEKTTYEITKVVGQIGVHSSDEGLFTEAGVEAEDHLPHEKIAERIEAINLEEIQRLDYRASTLGHFFLLNVPVTVNVEMLV